MSAPVSQRSIVRDAIVTILQDPVNCPLLIPLTSYDGNGEITATSIIGWQAGDVAKLSDAMIAANGIAVIVMVSSGDEVGGQEIGVTLDAPVIILISEQVEMNRGAGGSQLPGDYVAETILAALKYWQVPETQYILYPPEHGRTIVDGSPMRNLFAKDNESGFFTQVVNLKTRVGVAPRTNI